MELYFNTMECDSGVSGFLGVVADGCVGRVVRVAR